MTVVRAMLAYIFWRRPYSSIERQRYEQALAGWQRRRVTRLRLPHALVKLTLGLLKAEGPRGLGMAIPSP